MTHLQNKVLDKWEAEGLIYFELNDIGDNQCESMIKPEFQQVLDNIDRCLDELDMPRPKSEINSYNEYLRYLKTSNTNPPKWVMAWAREILERKELE